VDERADAGTESLNTVETMLTIAGPLLGVAMGSWLTGRQHTRNQRHEQYQQLRAERLAAHSRFITAARMWQSNVLDPTVQIITAHTGNLYTDAGDAYRETIRGLTEVRLVAGRQETIVAAIAWEQALRALSEARATSGQAPTPKPPIHRTKAAEDNFIATARLELTMPD
jgi:hypothetical protein